MKLKVTVNVSKGWQSIQSEEMEIEVPGDAIKQEEVNFLIGNANNMFRILTDRFMDFEEKQAKKAEVLKLKNEVLEGVEQSNESAYTLRNDITELQKALARKECQMDGLIQGINNNFTPTPDEANPQLLDGMEDLPI
jgi:hypothetical protein